MVTEFRIDNMTTSSGLTFGQTVNHDCLFKEDGLDWGYTQGDNATYSYPGQVGSYISMTSLKEREVQIVGWIYYVLSKDELITLNRKEKQERIYEVIKEKKRKMNAIINPLDFVRITIGNYYLIGKPSESIRYGNTRETNNEVMCQFLITVWCNNPMFRKLTEVSTVLSGVVPKWTFPWKLPSQSGFIFSERNNWLMLAVTNEGDIEVGGDIILTANGEVENPTIENITNGQKLTINKTMEKGEKIIINTADGSKRVVRVDGGKTVNYFQYWNYQNDWVKFPQGTSLVGYSTANESELLLDVQIDYNPQKLALEEQ